MNLETLKSPSGLCAYHRRIWKEATRRHLRRLAFLATDRCLSGESPYCSRGEESGR